MRALIAVIVVAFAAWSGWWYVASRAALSGAEAAFAGLTAQGWKAGNDGISVRGYPNRVDLTIAEPALATPDQSWGWQADFAQLFALSYRPWHLIAALPPRQTLTTPFGPADLEADKLQASLVVKPASNTPLERLQIAGEGLSLRGTSPWAAESLSLALHASAAEVNAYDLGLTLRELAPDPRLVALVPHGLLPERLPIVHLDATLGLTAPLDRHLAESRPQITHINLRELRGEWGPVKLHLSGRLTADAEGFAEGKLDLRIEGAATLLEFLGSGGVLAEKDMRNLSLVISAMSRGADSLTLPVNFARGSMALAVFPLGEAPRLRF